MQVKRAPRLVAFIVLTIPQVVGLNSRGQLPAFPDIRANIATIITVVGVDGGRPIYCSVLCHDFLLSQNSSRNNPNPPIANSPLH
jgi:hypothetical protein